MVSATERLRVLSLIPGRMRVHLSGWTAEDADELETRLCRVKGVERVQASPLTGNVLLRFDRCATEGQELLAEVQAVSDKFCAARQRSRPGMPLLLQVGLRGLLGHAVVDSLWFGAGFLGQAVGLPLAGLGPLHLLTDVALWGVTLGSATAGQGGGGTHAGS
jgi:hypothetical protein